MPYSIYQFDSLILPAYDAETDVGTGEVAPVFLDLPGGGVFDVLGTEQAKRRVTPINKVCTFTADTPAALRTAYNALRAYIGKRARLWRLWDSGEAEWCWARLTNIDATRPAGTPGRQVVDLRFVMISPHWYGTNHGGAWVFADPGEIVFGDGHLFGADETVILTATPQTITLLNGGNRAVTNAIISVTATSAPGVLNPRFRLGGADFGYTGVVGNGQTLVVDCGALSVKLDGADAYAMFSVNSGHASDDWLSIAPGSNDLLMTWSGGAGHEVTFSYYDGWE